MEIKIMIDGKIMVSHHMIDRQMCQLFKVVLTAEVTKINLFGLVSDDAHQSIGPVFVRQVSGIA